MQIDYNEFWPKDGKLSQKTLLVKQVANIRQSDKFMWGVAVHRGDTKPII